MLRKQLASWAVTTFFPDGMLRKQLLAALGLNLRFIEAIWNMSKSED